MKLKPVLLFLFLVSILIAPNPSYTQTGETEKVYKVAILPFMIRSQENLDYLRDGINDILTSRITQEERVEVIKRSVVERALNEAKPMRLDEAVIKKIAMKIKADYIVIGSITKIRDDISLEASLLSIAEEKPPFTVNIEQKGIDGVMEKIGDFARDIGYKILGRRSAAFIPDETKGPRITHAFAIKKIKYGDILKIYIEAEYPEGEMVRIGAEVDQAGYGRYPVSWVKLQASDRKHFKGYLQWNTFSSKTSTVSDGTPITVTVFVSDKNREMGKPFTFPITFESGVKRSSSYQVPSPFDQKEIKRLGYIDVELVDFTILHD